MSTKTISLFCLLLLVCCSLQAQSSGNASRSKKADASTAVVQPNLEDAKLELERQRIDLQRQQLELQKQQPEIELEKLRVERSKAIWTGLATMVPILIAFSTLWYTARSQNRQERLQRELQEYQMRIQFRIKAAELAMSATRPSAALARARMLQAMFPDDLPKGFAESIDAGKYSGTSPETKRELLKLVVEDLEHKEEIIHLWKALFPRDSWVDDLKLK
ncbi:MAG: hypothetical protein ABR577_18295 [Pyrinomonadaceae bacterium]